MGILFPLIGPLAWRLGGGRVDLLTHCFGAVLGGSLFGNVFSPIADTTILTQLATKVPLADHVKTNNERVHQNYVWRDGNECKLSRWHSLIYK